MPRLNPLSLKRAEPLTDSRDFADPLQPGQVLSLTLRVDPSAAARERRTARAQSLLMKYVTGDAEYVASVARKENPPRGQRPVGIPVQSAAFIGEGDDQASATIPLPGRSVLVTSNLVFYIATVMDLQEDAARQKYPDGNIPADERPYLFLDWVGISADMPSAWDGVVTFAEELLSRAHGLLKNSSAATEDEAASAMTIATAEPSTGTPSAPPSGAASDTTPLSSTGSSPSPT